MWAIELGCRKQGRESFLIRSVDIGTKLIHEVSKHVETSSARCAINETLSTLQSDALLCPSPKLGHVASNDCCDD
jgi:hypothetical protein